MVLQCELMNWENDWHLFVAHGIIAFSESSAAYISFSSSSVLLELLLVSCPLNDESIA